ncbi:MAG: hypothetical protein AB1831_12440 [Pseudomonadota bacterium]
MKATLKTLLTALLGVAALAGGVNAHADGRGDRDGWRDGDRYEYRWHDNGRHEGWRHHKHHRTVYRENVYVYPAPPVVYENRYYYGPTTYRYPSGPSVIIDLPPIIFR